MLRTILFWLHLVAGVLAGAIILIMSVTGVLLTYERQIVSWADTRQFTGSINTSAQQLSVDSLVSMAKAVRPTAQIASVTLQADRSAPAQVSLGQAGALYLDPTTGAVLGQGSATTRAFFRSVTDWHRWLAGTDENRKLGKQVTGIANLMFLVLVCTGMILWLPKTWTWIRLRAILWFRTGLSGKARDFNWHNVLGIWSALPLIAIVASATVIGYPWASDLVYKVAGEAPPPRGGPGGPPGQGGPPNQAAGPGQGAPGRSATTGAAAAGSAPRASLATALAAATPLMTDWRSVTVQVPKPDARTISVTLDRGTGGQPQLRSTVQIAAATGAMDKFQPFDSLSTGRQLRGILRFTHTGEVLGIFGQTIAGLVSFASVVLVATGIMLSIRRAARALGRRGRGRESETDAAAVTA